ncbi:MAG TPA: hypothetical protein PL155_02285 [Candidatus Omnitrophota bacterium]|nr:hypothetical protein [Candidatus Omnitrophota bacterium]HPD84686.1 hypothetical protein [Candidatus Omnitrophota bacterium]HRZ03544.1 hypothetical protein [Candidatus Omnitrophota bacterium]
MHDIQSIIAIAVVVVTLLIVIYLKLRNKGVSCEGCCCQAALKDKKSSSKTPKQ